MHMARMIEAIMPKTANPPATQNPNLISLIALEAIPSAPYDAYFACDANETEQALPR
jgi:hypothetical protein